MERVPQILTRASSSHNDSNTEDNGELAERTLLKKESEQPVRILQSHVQVSHQPSPIISQTNFQPSNGWLSSVLSDGRLSLPRKMTHPVKLVDNKWHWSAEPLEYLSDITDYLVVSVVGGQSVGKSFISSLLVDGDSFNPNDSPTFTNTAMDSRLTCHHETAACDLFVTPERNIIIDSQPILSPSVLDEFIHYDRKIAYEYPSFESCVLMQSLQMFCFNATISHVIVFVMDHLFDESVLSLLRTGELIKPEPPAMLFPSAMDKGSDGDKIKSNGWPRLVFVYNKCPSALLNYSSYTQLQRILYSRFESSKFNFNDGCGLKMMPLFCASSNAKASGHISDNVNLLLLPDCQSDPVNFRRASSCVRNAVLSSPKVPFLSNDSKAPMSELTWHQFATKTWEGVKRSKLFDDYTRLLP